MTSKEEARDIEALLEGCRRHDRSSQAALYKEYYAYGMSICRRYTANADEALEVLNDGFTRVFLSLNSYKEQHAFKAWVRRIWINCAIDYYRRQAPRFETVDMYLADDIALNEDILAEIASQDILAAVQQLPPSYRLVFNLFAIEGYNHREIAEILAISQGTSKSNLSKARSGLKAILHSMSKERQVTYG